MKKVIICCVLAVIIASCTIEKEAERFPEVPQDSKRIISTTTTPSENSEVVRPQIATNQDTQDTRVSDGTRMEFKKILEQSQEITATIDVTTTSVFEGVAVIEHSVEEIKKEKIHISTEQIIGEQKASFETFFSPTEIVECYEEGEWVCVRYPVEGELGSEISLPESILVRKVGPRNVANKDADCFIVSESQTEGETESCYWRGILLYAKFEGPQGSSLREVSSVELSVSQDFFSFPAQPQTVEFSE